MAVPIAQRSLRAIALLLAALQAVVLSVAAADSVQHLASECACVDRSLCKPLGTAAPPKEVFAFHTAGGGSNWKHYPFSLVTTVCVFGTVDPELLCRAHGAGVRVTVGVGFEKTDLGNATARALWVQQQLNATLGAGFDGVNLDIEGNREHRDALTALTKETFQAFKAAVPTSQVTFDTSISPAGVSGGYDLKALAEYTDFLFVMAYDECWGTKVAEANSPITRDRSGMEAYLGLNISPLKLALGLPWYGWDFPCAGTSEFAADGTLVPCSVVTPFGGAGWQVGYSAVLQRFVDATTPLFYDKAALSAYFAYEDPKGATHQLWFDNAATLGPKYALAKELGLRGVGFWTADMLDYGAANSTATGMWDAVRTNFLS